MNPRTCYLVFALLCVVCLLTSGCAVNLYKGKGVWLLRATVGTDQQVGAFELGKDGSLVLGNSSGKQSEAVGAAAGAIVEAVRPKILP